MVSARGECVRGMEEEESGEARGLRRRGGAEEGSDREGKKTQSPINILKRQTPTRNKPTHPFDVDCDWPPGPERDLAARRTSAGARAGARVWASFSASTPLQDFPISSYRRERYSRTFAFQECDTSVSAV